MSHNSTILSPAFSHPSPAQVPPQVSPQTSPSVYSHTVPSNSSTSFYSRSGGTTPLSSEEEGEEGEGEEDDDEEDMDQESNSVPNNKNQQLQQQQQQSASAQHQHFHLHHHHQHVHVANITKVHQDISHTSPISHQHMLQSQQGYMNTIPALELDPKDEKFLPSGTVSCSGYYYFHLL